MSSPGTELSLCFDHFFLEGLLPICILSPGGRILDANPALSQLLGYAREELCGQHFSCFLLGSQAVEALFLRRLGRKSRGSGTFESVCQNRSGRAIPVQVTLLRQDGESGDSVIATVQKRAATGSSREHSHDPLTGLASRSLLMDRLQVALERSRRREEQSALLLLNLNRFRDVNDSFGQGAGNRLLQEVAQRLSGCIRASDTLARCHGDHYAILLEGIRDSVAISRVLRAVFEAVSAPFTIQDQEILLTCGVGIALFPEDGGRAEELVRNAETAMKWAKEERHNRYQFFTQEMNTRARERLRLESALYRALESGEFRLHYQPQVDAATRNLIGVEALVRWQHPSGKLLGPDHFLPHLEDSRLIIKTGDWILRSACRQARSWRDTIAPDLKMGVNISPQQLQEPAFPERVMQILHETGLDPAALVLEITERLMMRNLPEIVQALNTLANRGVGVAIDDFGTGYSSLSHLKRFPVTALKIDRHFVSGIASSSHDRAITCAIAALGRELHLDVIAEGVETEEQLEFLCDCGCRQIQGFLFAPPMPPEEIGSWVNSGKEKPAQPGEVTPGRRLPGDLRREF